MPYTLEERRELIRSILPPGYYMTDPSEVDLADYDDEIPEVVTLYDVEEAMYKEEQARGNSTAKNPGFRGTYTAPSSSEPDMKLAGELLKKDSSRYKESKVGDMSAEDATFASWELVQAYPQLYIGKTNIVKCAVQFENIYNDIPWDFHYLYHPRSTSSLPKLFVPTEQFVRFLDIINARVGVHLTIPVGAPGPKYAVRFGSSGTPRPRYLGRTTTKEQYKALADIVPPRDEHDYCVKASVISIDELVERLDALDVSKMSKKKKKSKKKAQEAKQQLLGTLHEIQQFFGIRNEQTSLIGADGHVLKLDANKPMPYPAKSDVVFACIDVEAAEQASNTILEVGISILDVADVAGTAPGENCKNWHPKIKSHHLLVHETRFQRNYKYVKGCPEAFKFGESELPLRDDLAKRILQILNDCVKPNSGDGKTDQPRPLILVGHDVASDVAYLKTMGIELTNVHGFSYCADTKDIHQHWRGLPNGASLERVLDDLMMPFSHLHNAGNDAAYTMQILPTLVLRNRLTELQQKSELEEELEAQCRRNIAAAEAKQAQENGPQIAAEQGQDHEGDDQKW